MSTISYRRKFIIEGKEYEFPEELIFDLYREMKIDFFINIGIWCVICGLVPFFTLIFVLIKFPV